MASLQDKKIKDTYQGLIKTEDNLPLNNLPTELSDGNGNLTGIHISTQGNLKVDNQLEAGSIKTATNSVEVSKLVNEADGINSNDNDTSIPTSAAVKDYVDSNVTAQDLDFSGDSGVGSVDLDSELLNIVGTNGVVTSASGQSITIDASSLDTRLTTTESQISSEEAARIAADNTLQANIDVESANLSTLTVRVNDNENDINAANTNITNNTAAISTEATARQNADISLQSNINLEETARIAADSAEQTARELADSALQTQITSNDSDITSLQTNKVPYTGATNDVNLGEHQLSTGQVTFDQSPTGSAGVGVMRWNNTDGTLDLGLKGGAVTLQVGQENVLRVVNGTGLLLQEDLYQVVKVVGAQGQRLQVDLAQADSDLNSATSLGIVTEDIQNNQEGFITTEGHVRNINTTGSLQGETWNDGDVLYLSPTVAGQITNVKPLTPAHLIVVGFVEYAHQNNGKILVKVDNGYELEELHNVNITSLQNDDALVYDSALGYWKNDSTVSSRISSLESDTSTLQSDLSTETSNRVAGDSTLQGQIDTNDTDISNLQTSKQGISEKGQPNGYAPLDSGAKIQEIYLPDSILGQLSYQGTWDASTNTPDIGSPVGNLGDYYVVNTAGTYLSVSYSVGDWIISNGTAWEKVDNTDAVTTVFGRIGAIIANESDYSSFYPLISDLTTETSARTSGDTTLQNQIDAITANDIPATLALVNQNTSDITSLDSRVTTNEGNISTNTANITTVTNDAATNAVNITALDIQVTDNVNAIAALDASKQDNITAGSGIDITGTTITNTSPDQIVSISGTGSTTVTGTYPNFSVSSTGTEYTAGTGLQLVGTEFQNTAPDQTVSITGGDGVSITGTYPNFTVESIAGSEVIRDLFSGTGSQTAFTLSGTPANENYTQIYFNGVYQEKSGYTLAGNVVTFSEAPAAGLDVEVISITTITILGEVSSVNGQIGDVVVNVPVDSVNGQTGAVVVDVPVQSVNGQTGAVSIEALDDDSVTYSKLAAEYTTSAAVAASDVDFSTAQVFTKTLTEATTLTFSNTEIGMVKDLVITGNFALTLPAGSTASGEYDGTVSNLIQILVTGASEYWYSISQPQ